MERDCPLEERRCLFVGGDDRRTADAERIVERPTMLSGERLHLRDRRCRSVVPAELHERLREKLVPELAGILDTGAAELPVHLLDELDRSLAASEREVAEREIEHGVAAEPVEAERGAAVDRQGRMLVAAVVETEPDLESRQGVHRVRPQDDLPELLRQRHGLRDGGVGGCEAPTPRLGEPLKLEQLREPGEVARGPGGLDRTCRLVERPGIVVEPERSNDPGVLQG